MAKKKNLRGIPHNITKSLFGTMRYSNGGYMGDWLFNAGRNLGLKNVQIDIMKEELIPSSLNTLPLKSHLSELKNIIRKELIANGFPEDFIVEAIINIEFSDAVHRRTFYCYPFIVDKDGKKYESKRIIEQSYEHEFDPLVELSHSSSNKNWNAFRSQFSNIFYFLSPCAILILVCFCGFIIDKSSFDGDTSRWTHTAATIFIPAFFILGGVMVVTRIFLGNKTHWICISELAAILAINFLFHYL